MRVPGPARTAPAHLWNGLFPAKTAPPGAPLGSGGRQVI